MIGLPSAGIYINQLTLLKRASERISAITKTRYRTIPGQSSDSVYSWSIAMAIGNFRYTGKYKSGWTTIIYILSAPSVWHTIPDLAHQGYIPRI